MRFSAEDRRLLARRIRNRLPAALTSLRIPRIPQLMLVLSATIYVTPEALAQIAAQKVTPVFKSFDKTYTKEELQQKLPPMPGGPNLGQRIMTELTAAMNLLASRQSGTVQKDAFERLRTKQADKSAWTIHAARMKEAPVSTYSDANAVRAYFGSEIQKATSLQINAKLPEVAKWRKGIAMNLNPKSLFAGSAPPATGNVRYGLILSEITPARAAYDRVSIGDSTEEMQFAGHADVHWTIGQLSEDQGRRLFSFQEELPKAAPQAEPTIWDRFRKPKTGFKTNTRTENGENLLSGEGGQRLPDLRFDFAQEEDLVTLTYRMKPNGKKINQEQNFVLPIAGTLAVGRRFSDNWHVVETSAYNVLFDKNMPLVSVHYMHIEQRYKGEIAKEIDANTKVAVTGRAKGTGGVMADGEGERPEKYTLEFTKTF